ncbi:MAG: hisH1, partial [Massilibacillus sp.]|jgi:glutamine amidotransferase|nr:hisH1 [Massilibacillus sp.]
VPSEENIVTAFVEYGGKVTAAVGKKNVQAMQFHPEKSSSIGLKILENFVRL